MSSRNQKHVRRVPRSVVEKFWKCQICLKIMKTPKTIPECLHTFCSICIDDHLTRVTKCPTCAVELGCKAIESLRVDHAMDSILKTILASEATQGEEELLEMEPEKLMEPEKQRKESSSRLAEPKSLKEAKTGLTEEEARKLKGKQRRAEKMPMVTGSDDDDDDDDYRKPPVTKPARKVRRGRPRKTPPVSSEKPVSGQSDRGRCQIELPGIWLKLIPLENQERRRCLADIDVPYLRIKNVDQSVSLLIKYLKQKLYLETEDEVELYFLGKPLELSTKLYSLIDMWPKGDAIKATIGASAEEFVMTVKYGRKCI